MMKKIFLVTTILSLTQWVQGQNVGIGTTTPTALLHVEGVGTGGGNVLFVGSVKDSPGNPPASGPGTRMMWYPDKASFRVGEAVGNEWDLNQLGAHSMAVGLQVKASGDKSFAMGLNSSAEGLTSIAMGFQASATGAYGKSIGNFTSASGNISTAMGSSTIAPSFSEFVIGRLNTEYTPLSTTGWNNADRLFVVGNGADINNRSDALVIMKNGAIGAGISLPAAFSDLHLHNKNANQVYQRFTNSVTGTTFSDGLRIGIRENTHLAQLWNFENGGIEFGTNNTNRMVISNTGFVGIGTATPKARLHVVDSMVLFEGPFTVSSTPPDFLDPGRGAFMMWIPQHAAFRVGYNFGGSWSVANTGRFSFAGGSRNIASGHTSTAFGDGTEASGSISYAAGLNTKAIGDYSTAIGWLSNANGRSSLAAGYATNADGAWSTALGTFTNAIGTGSIAFGSSTIAGSTSSAAFGRFNVGNGNPISWVSTDPVFEVGIGSSDLNRSNAFTVLKNGKVGTGGVNVPEAALHVLHPNVSAEGIRIQNAGSNNRHWTLHTNNGGGTLILYSSIGGATPIGNFNGSTGAYTATSNRHLKTNVQLLDADVLARIQQLQPASYSYLRDPLQQRTIGFMAEDVQPIFPELVETIGENGENMAINYAGFSVVAIKAIQLLEEKLSEKEKRIETLEAEMKEIKKWMMLKQ